MAITLVEQEFKSIENRQDYRTGTGMTYEEIDISMDIGKAKVFQLQCIWIYIAKDCRKPKREQDTRKYYKYNKIGHTTKNCKI